MASLTPTPRITSLVRSAALALLLVCAGALAAGCGVMDDPADPAPGPGTPGTPGTPGAPGAPSTPADPTVVAAPSGPTPSAPGRVSSARHTAAPIVAGTVTVVTDRRQYSVPAQVATTARNHTGQTIFLGGCSIFSRQRHDGAGWVDEGSDKVCVWEGLAVPLAPGASARDTVRIGKAGTWRVALRYGVGCKPGKPLSQAGCAAMRTAVSAPFKVGAIASGTVTVKTDKLAYRVGEDAIAGVHNGLSASVFLSGCTQVTRQMLVKGQWVDRGRNVACVWEGYAVEVKAGAGYKEPSAVRFSEPGTWRVALLYGVGCQRGQPLSQAGCTSMHTAVSAPVSVAR